MVRLIQVLSPKFKPDYFIIDVVYHYGITIASRGITMVSRGITHRRV